MRMQSTHSPAYNSSVYTFLSILYENVDGKNFTFETIFFKVKNILYKLVSYSLFG